MRIAGIDIGGTRVKVGLVDTRQGLLEKTSFETILNDPEKMADAIAQHVRRMDVRAVGIGTAGSVHSDTGLVYASNLNWWGIPLRAMLEEKLNMPVWVDNDAQTAMMAETFDGALQGVRNGVYLTLGTGVGGALLLDGKPWRSSRNVAAEFGHMITHGDGLLCACKRRGCFEMYASATALKRMAGGMSVKEVFRLAGEGDAACKDILNAYYRELAIGMVSITSIFNPDVIAIGGGVSGAGQMLIEGISAAYDEQMSGRKDFFKGKFCLAVHGNDAGMLGAAKLAEYYLFPEAAKR